MSKRDTSVCCDAEWRSYSGHHLKRDTGLDQTLHLFSAAAKYEGISALQTHNRQLTAGSVNHQLDDFGLRESMISALFTDVNAFRVSSCKTQEGRVGQMIVKN